ncbi:uncharacterized protein LOC116350089 [Contarinia nasturtii]|uniref:uncharacterized protein LOC116350089 n=1 Tax=Contarinia nasturtii TaxID=265458 RepID=UPI0012D38FB8|nr:uncharacterized protein LOC116350089 [Contarinia nasturtii]
MAFNRDGLRFNAEFKQYFLRVSYNRIKETYDRFEIDSLSTSQAYVDEYGDLSTIIECQVVSSMCTKNVDTNEIQNQKPDPLEINDLSNEEERNQVKLESECAIQFGGHGEDDGSYPENNTAMKMFNMKLDGRDINKTSVDTFTATLCNGSNAVDGVNITAKSTKSSRKRAESCLTPKSSSNQNTISSNPMEAKKRLKCTLCEYSSNKKSHVNRHMLTHTGEKTISM